MQTAKAVSVFLFLALLSSTAFSQEKVPTATANPVIQEKVLVSPADPSAPQTISAPTNLFAEQQFMSADERLKNKVTEVRGLLFIEKKDRANNTHYAIVTNFADGVVRSRSIPNLKTAEDIDKWVEGNVKSAKWQGVEIKKLPVPEGLGAAKNLYWIGHKSVENADQAKSQIDSIKSQVESGGGNFALAVQEAEAYARPVIEDEQAADIKTPAQFQKEERIVLKILDQLNIGDKMFGPFQGVGTGEPILWQSFGEGSWRNTNLETEHWNNNVGYWTNRLVFKGIRAPIATIDPFVETTISMETVPTDYKNTLKLYGGVEWRPLERNPFLNNFRPWGLPLLDWARNARLFMMYGSRKPMKGPITGSHSNNLVAGMQIYYDWGQELPSVAEMKYKTTFADYLREYVWGQYYGDYHFETTNFSAEREYNSFIFNSSIIMGIRLPGIPLPPNPINNEFVAMPYVKLEHVNSTEFSYRYQNQVYLAAGVSWMPFRTYRHKENEWLAKMRFYFEYVGMGGVYNPKQGDNDSYVPMQYDYRIGISFSSRRY